MQFRRKWRPFLPNDGRALPPEGRRFLHDRQGRNGKNTSVERPMTPPLPRTIVFCSDKPETTRNLAEALGRRLGAGAVIALSGDLGAGKTAFVQGLARGLGIPRDDPVTSPTYTLVNEYSGREPLFHVDLYRLPPPVDIESLGLEAIDRRQGVVAIEWAERMATEDLGAHLALAFTIEADGCRTIAATACGLDAEDLLQAFENSIKELS